MLTVVDVSQRLVRGLADLQQAGELVPNQSVLINTFPLLEAKDSSEIENIVTTADKLFQFANHKTQQSDPATREALRYRSALNLGCQLVQERPLCTGTAVAICSRLTGIDMEIRRAPGTSLANETTGEIVYTPPEGEAHLRDLLANWERFLHEQTEIEPLIRLAVAHYQFEAIHPFTDGNGRAGRIINLLFLIEQDLLQLPVLYLSRYINQNRAEYYRLLRAVTTDQAWEPWILYLLDAIETTATWTRDKIVAIRELMDRTAAEVQTALPSIYSRELVEIIFVQPYCRIANLVEAHIAKRQTASVYLKQLCEIGVLEEIKVGREKLFINPQLMRLLTQKE
ncbi:MAG: Fic/DOC family N-terminal domain-containing protein [Haliea sp.]